MTGDVGDGQDGLYDIDPYGVQHVEINEEDKTDIVIPAGTDGTGAVVNKQAERTKQRPKGL